VLNANWLATFVTLCDLGHFTRAAAAMNMTQPGVSQHVRKLEQQIGQPLITRDGKSFAPTPAGEAVLAVGRRRQAEDRQLGSMLAHDNPDVGEVSVASSGSLAQLLYPCFMDLMATAPALFIRLEAMPQARIFDAVISGDVDLGIVSHAPAHARLEGVRVGNEDLCLLLPLGCATPRSFAHLEALGFIAHPDGLAYADALLGANFPAEYPGSDRLRQRSFINQIGQIAEPVARGIGYTILPRSGVESFVGKDRLIVVPLANRVQHELWLIQRKGRSLPARTQRLGSSITNLLAAL
jgi:DNA-binding transcriptional LysR family regulator